MSVQTAMEPPPGVDYDFSTTSLQRGLAIDLIVTFSFATVTLLLRLYTRIFILRRVDFDDALIVGSWGSALGFFIVMLKAIGYGMGKHMWNVSMPDYLQYANLIEAIGITYIIAPSVTKLAILFMYFRINSGKWFRVCLGAITMVNIAYTVETCIQIAVICPRNTATMGQCLSTAALAQAILNIFTDCAIIVLPIPTIHSLHLPMQQKVVLAFIFTLGSSVIVASIARVKAVMDMQNNPDTTHAFASAALWSSIEVNIGVACNCLAVLKPFVKKHFSRFRFLLGSTKDSRPSHNLSGDAFGNSRKPKSYELGSVDVHSHRGNIKVTHDFRVETNPKNGFADDDSTEGIVTSRHVV